MKKAKYVGYVWYSDQTEPLVLDGTELFEPDLTEGNNPFIVEAQLYDASGRKSYSIRFWNGSCHVVSYDVPERVGKQEITEDVVAYNSNRMGNRRLLFWQQWKEQQDDLCLGMSTLVPKALVFVGFEK